MGGLKMEGLTAAFLEDTFLGDIFLEAPLQSGGRLEKGRMACANWNVKERQRGDDGDGWIRKHRCAKPPVQPREKAGISKSIGFSGHVSTEYFQAPYRSVSLRIFKTIAAVRSISS
jgi:hypothetical protein